jgi:hypothetical protein
MEIIPRQLTGVRAQNAPPGNPPRALARPVAMPRRRQPHRTIIPTGLVPGLCPPGPGTLSPRVPGLCPLAGPGDRSADPASTAPEPHLTLEQALAPRVDWTTWWSWRGAYTRSHPELGREIPQRPWYCVSRHGRVGRRQVFQSTATAAPAKQSGEAGSTQGSSRHLIHSPPPPTRGGAAR